MDFRKCCQAFVVVAFLVSIAVPAYADFTCNVTAVNVPVRAESNDDNGGNIVLTCSGGVPTTPGNAIPPTTITVFANTNITSRTLATLSFGTVTTHFNEALLMIDEPNTSPVGGGGNGHVMSNCGFNGEDSDPASGPGVCRIIAPVDPASTYDGSYTGCAFGAFSCGHPNVFQGRQAVSLIGGQFNVVQFVGVPLDPAGPTSNRVIRIANLHIDATRFGVTSPFSVVPVTATVSFAGFLAVPDATVQIASVQQGMTTQVFGVTGFLQCVGTDTVSGNSASSPFYSGSGGMSPTGVPSPTGGMDIRVFENFSVAWKVRNLSMILANGVFSGFGYAYGGAPGWSSTDLNQNVPGVFYNTEAGFENGAPGTATPSPNPPAGYGSPVLALANPFVETVGPTNIQNAGVASQGTRISIQVGSIPAGARLFFPITVLLKNQSNAAVTGVIQVDALADQNGFTTFTSGSPAPFLAASPTAFLFTASGGGPTGAVTNTTWVEVTSAAPVITYEVLFSRADALEYADIISAVVYNDNGVASNLPQPGVIATATASFAPIASGLANPSQPQPDGPYATPRFASTFKAPGDTLFAIGVCAVCATNSNASVTVTRGVLKLHHGTQRYDQMVAVTNTSASPISGPLSLVLDGLSANASLFGGDGVTTCGQPLGSPFVNLAGGPSLGPGARKTVILQFTNPSNQGITYSTRVLTGSGAR